MNISQRLIGLQNILRAEISAIHHTLLTQIKHPTQQNNHPDKTILASIVNMLKNRTATTTINKVRTHTNIIGNEEADKLAKEGSKIELADDIPTEPHENAHSYTILVVQR
jgi:ribonuclease HI